MDDKEALRTLLRVKSAGRSSISFIPETFGGWGVHHENQLPPTRINVDIDTVLGRVKDAKIVQEALEALGVTNVTSKTDRGYVTLTGNVADIPALQQIFNNEGIQYIGGRSAGGERGA